MKLVNLKFTSKSKNFTVKFNAENNDSRPFVVVNNFTAEIVAKFGSEFKAWQHAKTLNLSN